VHHLLENLSITLSPEFASWRDGFSHGLE